MSVSSVEEAVKNEPKLTIPEQIRYMRDERGIAFNIVTEEEAAHFLREHNYFYKLKSYAKNYTKNTAGENKGKYSDLEFAYLKELSTLDMYFRKAILDMTIDIEHYLKVKLLRDSADNKDEDGYSIVKKLLETDLYIKKRLKDKMRHSGCNDAVNDNGRYCYSMWKLAEILSFGEFISLYKCYYAYYQDKTALVNCIEPVRFLRNAAAHNNGILRNLNAGTSVGKQNLEVSTYTSRMIKDKALGISGRTFDKKMSNGMIHDFVCMLYVFNHIVTSEQIKEKSMARLLNLFDNRFVKNSAYFENNALIKSCYGFARKILDIYT